MKNKQNITRSFSYLVDQQCSYRATVVSKPGAAWPIVLENGWSGDDRGTEVFRMSKAGALKLAAILFAEAMNLPDETGSEYMGAVL